MAFKVVKLVTEFLEEETPYEWPLVVADTLDKLQQEEGILQENREYNIFREETGNPNIYLRNKHGVQKDP
ncbi:hypothetical protein N7539_008672 [Penicillium diatomitis]|uniref:Uncharacterized protein n=1 Tax=Penicillium diatomitis TaxID=2819901 RepID=A0A9X0BM56_9EURO|nr:uncharacterized protein N7539_008672 [Penicillium diatomitis]KAJ5472103.1 hypothetical protein N7539_008672 [Penicillium diatomitis]